jgi:hypothetical protein
MIQNSLMQKHSDCPHQEAQKCITLARKDAGWLGCAKKAPGDIGLARVQEEEEVEYDPVAAAVEAVTKGNDTVALRDTCCPATCGLDSCRIGAVFTLGSREGVLSWDIGAWEAPFTALQVTETLSVGASVQGAPAGDGEDGAVAVVTERTSDAPARVQIVHCLA